MTNKPKILSEFKEKIKNIENIIMHILKMISLKYLIKNMTI